MRDSKAGAAGKSAGPTGERGTTGMNLFILKYLYSKCHEKEQNLISSELINPMVCLFRFNQYRQKLEKIETDYTG